MNLFKQTLSLITLAIVFSSAPMAGEAEDKGLKISKEAKARDEGWGDSTAELEMILKNQHGQTSIRKMRLKSIEQENDGDKSLTTFDTPRDIKGVAFLSFSHPVGNDEQWLYLPARKRVKSIITRTKSNSFMGSEFSFEDLTSFEVEKFNYLYLKEEVFDGEKCWVITQFPLDKYSGYKRRIVWIDQSEYRVRKTDFYDRKNSLLKTLTFSNFHLYLDKYWRAQKFVMINHQSGKSTILNYSDFKMKTGLNEKDFDKNALKRAR